MDSVEEALVGQRLGLQSSIEHLGPGMLQVTGQNERHGIGHLFAGLASIADVISHL